MELSIPASPSRLARLRRAVRADLRGVSEEVADDVVLALHEVATNAVLHGSSGGQPIQVVVHVNDDWVEASVLGHGPQPPPSLSAETDTDELRAGGRGLWLLGRLVDEVRIERVQLGTRVTLRRAIGPAGTLTRSRLSHHG
jgi:anti-sigma regulatory factor (Ser/Thr protein kinase)